MCLAPTAAANDEEGESKTSSRQQNLDTFGRPLFEANVGTKVRVRTMTGFESKDLTSDKNDKLANRPFPSASLQPQRLQRLNWG